MSLLQTRKKNVHLKRFDDSQCLLLVLLLLDNVHHLLDNLVSDVINMASALCCRNAVDERHLSETGRAERARYLPALVHLLVH